MIDRRVGGFSRVFGVQRSRHICLAVWSTLNVVHEELEGDKQRRQRWTNRGRETAFQTQQDQSIRAARLKLHFFYPPVVIILKMGMRGWSALWGFTAQRKRAAKSQWRTTLLNAGTLTFVPNGGRWNCSHQTLGPLLSKVKLKPP